MDELEIAMLIRKCKILKYKFKGVFAADNFPPLSNNSFVIVNSSRANNIGTHWILFCKRESNYSQIHWAVNLNFMAMFIDVQ